jgi:tetratricopeptide (TPR) repeat protein
VCYAPAYIAPVYYAPPPVIVTPVPFYAYPRTVVVTNYVERVVEAPAPNLVALDGATGATPAPVAVAGPAGYPVPTSASMAAWSALNAGDAARAGDAFRAMLAADALDTRAQVGAGLAAMLEGRDDEAVAAFRTALGSEPGSLSGLPISTALSQRIRDRAEQLWAQPRPEAAFLAAVGYSVIGDPALAVRVASRAIELGDRTNATAQLRAQLAYALGGG